MEMVRDRTLTSHTYNETIAKAIVAAIRGHYFSEFLKLHAKLTELKEQAA